VQEALAEREREGEREREREREREKTGGEGREKCYLIPQVGQVPVAHTCNPSYLGGSWFQVSLSKQFWRPHLNRKS
jgi:hypothetical protein